MEHITYRWLKSQGASQEYLDWFNDYNQEGLSYKEVINNLMKINGFYWGNWLIVRLLDIPSRQKYAIYAAELVLQHYVNKNPDDKRIREAIEAVKGYLVGKSGVDELKKNNHIIAATFYAAADNCSAVYAAACNARAADYVINAAVDEYAMHFAVTAAYAYAVGDDMYVAAVDTNVDYTVGAVSIKTKIIEYGLNLFEREIR